MKVRIRTKPARQLSNLSSECPIFAEKYPVYNKFIFKKYTPPELSIFDKLFGIFKELIVHTSGDFDEAITWIRELDREYKITTSDYTIEDFIEDLKKKRLIREAGDKDGKGGG